ncbi:MAG: exodeoxyribonuclease III [Gammaproteobacteria bacterium]|nr:MAG: exodeoxyribonuclease III [Gammaproteobacteria bacterium]
MNIVSFNVNSLRQRLHQIEAVIEAHQPLVIGLQETKVTDEAFPVDAIEALGYHVAFTGQKTHYGVAIMSKVPLENVIKGFATDTEEAQKRLISARVRTPGGREITVINGYFPQGEKREHPVKFPAKEAFYADLLSRLETDHSPEEPLVVLGDYNIAPVDADLGIGEQNVRRWLRSGKTSFLPEEREWFERLVNWGLVDSYRRVHPEKDDLFSWFDYRSRGFEQEPKRGLRIDHLLCTAPLADALTDSGIDYAIRAMERPSDHCPVWSSFDY